MALSMALPAMVAATCMSTRASMSPSQDGFRLRRITVAAAVPWAATMGLAAADTAASRAWARASAPE